MGSETRTATGRIVLASLVGTAIEFYDFYIYGTAAASFATFGIAFVARPSARSCSVISATGMGGSRPLSGHSS